MACPSPILISPLALSQVDYKVLQVAVNLLAEEGMNCNLLENNNLGGHLAVIDTDTSAGKDLIEKVGTGQAQLVISSQSSYSGNSPVLQKPVRVNALKEQLAKVCEQIHPDDTNTLNTPEEEKEQPVYERAHKTVFDVLFDAKQKDMCLQIHWNESSVVYVNGKTSTIATELSLNSVDTLSNTPVETLVVKTISEDLFQSFSQDLNILALDGVLWQAAISCSRGIILSGHSLDTPVKLKAWPNFTRQSFNPIYLRLAAVLARQATTLNQLKSETNVPLKDIVNFYNAVYAVGLIEFQTHKVEVRPMEAKKNTPRLKELFSRLAVRLKIA